MTIGTVNAGSLAEAIETAGDELGGLLLSPYEDGGIRLVWIANGSFFGILRRIG